MKFQDISNMVLNLCYAHEGNNGQKLQRVITQQNFIKLVENLIR